MNNTEKLNELRKRASEKFSDVEITDFIELGKQLACKSILTVLVKMLEEYRKLSLGLDDNECMYLISDIERYIPSGPPKCVQCTFEGIPYKLNIALSIVDRNYKTVIDIPDATYNDDIIQKYNFLKQVAIAYWRQFTEEQPLLYDRLCKYKKDTDFSMLKVDPNNLTTLYFDPNSTSRIGIFCFYVDENNNPFIKRN